MKEQLLRISGTDLADLLESLVQRLPFGEINTA